MFIAMGNNVYANVLEPCSRPIASYYWSFLLNTGLQLVSMSDHSLGLVERQELIELLEYQDQKSTIIDLLNLI